MAEAVDVRDARDDGRRRRLEPVLVGREAQIAAATGLVDALLLGRGGVLWIDGGPGMGKTALVDVLAARAERRGATVLRAAGDELMEDFPLRLMAACLGVSGRSGDPARAEITGLLRGGSPFVPRARRGEGEAGDGAEQAGDPFLAARERMLALVERLCAQGPVLLAAEDLQWSDEMSLGVWGRLARAVGRMPLLLVGTARPAPRRAAVDLLRVPARGPGLDAGSAGPHVALELPPLAEEEAAVLAGLVAGATPGPRLRTELARAGGNPLYVRSLVEALLGDGLVTVAPAEAAGRAGPAGAVPSCPNADGQPSARESAEFTGPVGAMPDALAEVIGRRLGLLSGEIISLLRLAALLGARFDPAQLAAVGAAAPESVARALGAAEGVGVLSGGDRPAFANELIRQVLVGQIPISLRRTLHGHIARTLMEVGAPGGMVVRHLRAAGAELDAGALDWLARAPLPVLDGVPADAASLLRRAVRAAENEAGPTDPGRRRYQALATRLAGALYLTGRDEEAAELARSLAGSVEDREIAARMTELAARAVLRSGRRREAVDLVREALADEEFPALWRTRLRAVSSRAFAQLGEIGPARAAAAAALAEAYTSGDRLTVALAHRAASLSAPPSTALEHNSAALAELGADAESADLRIALATDRLVWLYEQGDHAGYRRLLSRLLRLGERLGPMRSGIVLLRAATIAHLGGDWDEALALLDGLGPERLAPPELVRLYGLRALIHVCRGEREHAARALAAAEKAAAGMAPADRSNGRLVAARAVAAEASGDPDRALDVLAALFDASHTDFPLPDDQLPVLVRLALAAGDDELALAATRGLERRAAEEPSPRRAALARWCRGQVDDDPAGLLAAAEAMAAAWPFDSAGARQDAAVRLAAGGEGRAPDAARARAALTAAVRLYSGMGAQWAVRRADASVRVHGVRRGPRSAHRRETTGWGALTVSEQRIALLVGQGWSNPDIATELMLSRHTVQAHVSNILGKLRLGSRIEIVRAVKECLAAGQCGP